jgi:hypothetical protein
LQQLQVLADGAADQHLLAVLQRLANAFAARHLAHPVWPALSCTSTMLRVK